MMVITATGPTESGELTVSPRKGVVIKQLPMQKGVNPFSRQPREVPRSAAVPVPLKEVSWNCSLMTIRRTSMTLLKAANWLGQLDE